MTGTATEMAGEEILTELPEEAVSLAEAMNATSVSRASGIQERLRVLVARVKRKGFQCRNPKSPRQPSCGAKALTEGPPHRFPARLRR